MPLTSKQRLIPPFLAEEREIPRAMIDHAEMVIGDWAVSGNPHDVVRFLDAIPGIVATTCNGVYIRAFTMGKRSPIGKSVDIAVTAGRPGNVAYQTVPVFGGKISHAFGLSRVPRSTPGEYVRLGLEASLNLNRFLAAQVLHRRTRLDRPRLALPLATAIAGAFAQYEDEFCLTDDTNVVIAPDLFYRYILSKSAEEHFVHYVRVVERFMAEELQSIAREYDVTVRHLRYYSLRKIEFVWEFAHPHPTTLVESLDVPIRALGPQSQRHRAMVRGERLFVYQDSIAVSVELSGGCDLVIYAKTNKRVRCEVRMDSNCIGGEGLKATGQGSRTARRLRQILRMIANLRIVAEQRLRLALEMLDRQISPPDGATVPQLCARLGRILKDDMLVDTVIEILSMRGSLASAQGSPLKDAAQTLTDAGILRRKVLRSTVFVPTDHYVSAVRSLRSWREHSRTCRL